MSENVLKISEFFFFEFLLLCLFLTTLRRFLVSNLLIESISLCLLWSTSEETDLLVGSLNLLSLGRSAVGFLAPPASILFSAMLSTIELSMLMTESVLLVKCSLLPLDLVLDIGFI